MLKHELSIFIKNIEEHIFLNKLIYRSIIVVNSNIESKILKKILHQNDYSSEILSEVNKSTNYNEIDNRILIMTHDIFKDFVVYLFSNNDEYNSYNCIGISHTISESIVEDLKNYYLMISRNNMNNTIIFDKKYSDLLYLIENI